MQREISKEPSLRTHIFLALMPFLIPVESPFVPGNPGQFSENCCSSPSLIQHMLSFLIWRPFLPAETGLIRSYLVVTQSTHLSISDSLLNQGHSARGPCFDIPHTFSKVLFSSLYHRTCYDDGPPPSPSLWGPHPTILTIKAFSLSLSAGSYPLDLALFCLFLANAANWPE